jgi:hypothetical protein
MFPTILIIVPLLALIAICVGSLCLRPKKDKTDVNGYYEIDPEFAAMSGMDSMTLVIIGDKVAISYHESGEVVEVNGIYSEYEVYEDDSRVVTLIPTSNPEELTVHKLFDEELILSIDRYSGTMTLINRLSQVTLGVFIRDNMLSLAILRDC